MAQVEYAIVPAYVGPIALQFTVVQLPPVTMVVQELGEGGPIELGGFPYESYISIDTQCAPGLVLGLVLATSPQGYLSIV